MAAAASLVHDPLSPALEPPQPLPLPLPPPEHPFPDTAVAPFARQFRALCVLLSRVSALQQTDVHVLYHIAALAVTGNRHSYHNLLTRACRTGDLPVVRACHSALCNGSSSGRLMTPSITREMVCSIFQDGCLDGHLPVLQWIHATFALTAEDARDDDNVAFQWACQKGHLSVAQWLYTTFALTAADARSGHNHAFKWACECGHLHVVQWLHVTFSFTADDARSGNNYAFRWTCAGGQLAVAKWLHTTFTLTREDAQSVDNSAYRDAHRNKHTDVTEWLCSTFFGGVVPI